MHAHRWRADTHAVSGICVKTRQAVLGCCEQQQCEARVRLPNWLIMIAMQGLVTHSFAERLDAMSHAGWAETACILSVSAVVSGPLFSHSEVDPH